MIDYSVYIITILYTLLDIRLFWRIPERYSLLGYLHIYIYVNKK
jgi:hypothetical protein